MSLYETTFNFGFQAQYSPLSPLQSALPQNAPVTPVEFALTKKPGRGAGRRDHGRRSRAQAESCEFNTKKARQLRPASRSPMAYLNQKWQDATPRFCKYFW